MEKILACDADKLLAIFFKQREYFFTKLASRFDQNEDRKKVIEQTN